MVIASKEKTVAKAAKLRGQGDRAGALAVAAEAGLTVEEAPFLDGYAEYLQASKPQPAPKK
jgi:hypothetical protein